MEINVSSSFGGLSTLLTVAFVVLKLCGVISWSWFLVFLPIIIGIAIILLIIIVLLIVWLITRN